MKTVKIKRIDIRKVEAVRLTCPGMCCGTL